MAFNVSRGTRADMHTHSETSHDSVCRIEDMLLTQLERGTEIMAVTDHLDLPDYDIDYPFEEFCRGDRIVRALNDKYKDRCLVLSGVELGEGFWDSALCDRIMNLIDFDVILGSIHIIKYKNIDTSFTRIDFSVFSEEDIYGFIDKYFDDVITMILVKLYHSVGGKIVTLGSE